ncbi:MULTISPECIES: OsmC family protein [unclassified Pseudomonas]|uniref:OsmC family protein n=1 Tax=unclassified Pseudomonas TaxID=196821 RepID=UPI0024483F3B|nr:MULTISPECIES: OsmC family protein [unclassified Pseudomonas]MDG9927084.1 OsmC family protein [Pseudomonas sp. GD04042]MDH0482907.1 OsmC family protein [Pseudomonas sp. GD04015]MDH0602499.1 OsmC family protein [Pseudomonas sp. GD03869]
MIRISTESGLRHSIEIGEHQLHTDVPVAHGGASAPEPHDLFDAALGACKALTLMLYARQRGLPLDSLDVRVNHDDSQERQGTYRLAVELELHGTLDEEQRQQLLRIADKCPVHKLMTGVDVQIETRLDNGA